VEGAESRLAKKLYNLKVKVKKWITSKKKIDRITLEKIEEEIASLPK